MRPFLPKNLIFFTSSSFSSSAARALVLGLQVYHFSASPNFPYHQSRRLEEESRNVRVSVWWDFENCNLPAGVKVSRIAPAITEAVRANGIKGPLQITAFGDVLQISRANQDALAYTGIHLAHIPNGGKNSADRSLLVDLLYWVSQNPPPAHLFLISGDKDFAGILHRLRMNNYNILLAVPGRPSDVLCSAATIMWQWSSLLKGEDLIGKHFNHPPDGPIGSWYGNYKVPLVNRSSAGEQSTSLQNVEINEPTSDSKLAAIPKSVGRQVRHILSLHPKGISITDLRAELATCEVRLDKYLYGHKRFSRFLQSIPHIQLQPLGDGNFCVHLIPSDLESPEPFESSVVPSTTSTVKNEERDHAAAPKLNDEGKNLARDAEGIPSMASLHERSSEKVVDVANEQLSETQLPPKDNEVSKTKMVSLQTRSKMLTDNDIVRSEDVSHKIPKKYTTSENHSAGVDYTTMENDGIGNDESGKIKSEDKYGKPTTKDADDTVVDKRPGGNVDTCSKSPTFFSRIRSWWPFWKSSAKSDDLTTPQNKAVSHSEGPKLSELNQTDSRSEEPKLLEGDQNVGHSEKPELFSNVSFWNYMESFVFSSKGSLLFSQSTNREDMARKLRKDGPLVLRSLTEKGILQLVDLLIAEKKWLEESPSQAFPFRLTQPVQKSSLAGQSLGANGLRSLFINRTSPSGLQKSSEHDVEKHNQSIPQTRVSTPATKLKCTERSRNEILVDCQKLVDEILREHPEGFNMSTFRNLFVERYGYTLDLQKLGYQKLASLFLTMPGVKLENTYIYPSIPAVGDSDQETSFLKTEVTNASHAVSNSDSELSDSAPKDDNPDSPWEELGPISVNISNHSYLESKLSRKTKELDTSKHPDYEPIVLDYDSSESEEDRSCLTQPEEQAKRKCNEQDSSFWQALDSWHSSKEGESSVKKSDKFDGLGICLADILSSSSESTQGVLSTNSSGNYREKRKSQKSYSFVADPVLPNKDKLIDGIFDGFKKTDESKMQN